MSGEKWAPMKSGTRVMTGMHTSHTNSSLAFSTIWVIVRAIHEPPVPARRRETDSEEIHQSPLDAVELSLGSCRRFPGILEAKNFIPPTRADRGDDVIVEATLV